MGSEIGKFGEPWRSETQWCDIRDSRDRIVGFLNTPIDTDHAIVCVNALAGIETPEAVREVVEAARDVSCWLHNRPWGHPLICHSSVARLQAALAGLDACKDEATIGHDPTIAGKEQSCRTD